MAHPIAHRRADPAGPTAKPPTPVDGIGKVIYASEVEGGLPDSYEGAWADGKIHGHGIYSYSDGSVFEGDFVEGKMHGRGAFNFGNGAKYDGDWADDERCGYGMLYKPNGETFAGYWKHSRVHGEGIMKYSNGDKYVGGWAKGKKHGEGEIHYANKDVFRGMFANGKASGEGTITYAARAAPEEAGEAHGQLGAGASEGGDGLVPTEPSAIRRTIYTEVDDGCPSDSDSDAGGEAELLMSFESFDVGIAVRPIGLGGGGVAIQPIGVAGSPMVVPMSNPTPAGKPRPVGNAGALARAHAARSNAAAARQNRLAELKAKRPVSQRRASLVALEEGGGGDTE